MKALLVLSGGQDSTTCLYWAKQIKKYEIHAVTFDYGQKHQRELMSARMIATIGEVSSHEIIEMGAVLKGASPLINPDEKLEQYSDHHSLPGGIEKTFVPMRNQLFLTIGFNRAIVKDCQAVITGVCEEDYGGYPDCREAFIQQMELASNLALFGEDVLGEKYINIFTPLMSLTKAESIRLALSLEGCYEALTFSHTSYDGQYPPTGHDHATLLRAKGFEEADVPDPLVLRAYLENKMNLPDTKNYRLEHYPKYLKRIENFLSKLPDVYKVDSHASIRYDGICEPAQQALDDLHGV